MPSGAVLPPEFSLNPKRRMTNSILFVSTDNRARSQMAEIIYNHLSKTKNASSAGTQVKEGDPIHPDVFATFDRHFLKYPDLFAKQLTREMVDKADKIILMTQTSVPAYVKNSPKVTYWDIDNPQDMGLNVYEVVYKKIREKITIMREFE